MSEHTYKIIEVVGSSKSGIEDAIETAIASAGDSLSHLRWFQVVETRGMIEGGKPAYYQVTLKIGFTLADHGSD